ncbi:hypothetical protein POM88_022067 [Heracleum sosnowskyi]|uniref:Uncharacterized protein n=1 Tax=Heracleum sosnowskyi TaxID=360622 RepID=A0AAD8MTE6_9APIA|nr:hypothetical protein POM88_022067 [Heracleum sosnowskyi]
MYILMQPLCGTDPMIVMEYSMLVLESCPSQTIELFLSGNIPADFVNSYLKQHAPNMQATYLELMLAMNEHGISGNLQNEMSNAQLSRCLLAGELEPKKILKMSSVELKILYKPDLKGETKLGKNVVFDMDMSA